MSDTKHISEIIDNISKQQSELANIFGEASLLRKNQISSTSQGEMSKEQLAEWSYRKTIRYWMDKVSEAHYHIRKNQKKIEDLYQ